jgi:hypothetical protein
MRCSLGTWESRRKTSGSMTSGFFNHFSQLLRRLADEFSAAFDFAIALLSSFFKGFEFVRSGSVLPEGIISGFDFHFSESNDVRPRNDTDVFPADSSSEPFAEVSFSVSNG